MDMLHGPIWNRLIVFAIPIALTSILEQLFHASDLAIVGQFTGELSTAAVAAVGANAPVVSLILDLMIGISLGTSVTIGISIGRKDTRDVDKIVHTSIVFALTTGLIIAVLGQFIAGWVLESMQVPADVMDMARIYLMIYLAGLPASLLYNFEAAIYRSVGETRLPLMALAISGVINVLLNIFFVVVLHMNVDGVAIATVLSNCISALILFYKLCHTDQIIQVHLRKLKIHWPTLRRILRIGLPSGIQTGVFSLANIVIQSAINSLGTVVIAASSAAYNLEIFCYYCFGSFTKACTTFTSQNYGAGQLDRCRKVFWLCMVEAFVGLSCVDLLLLSFSAPLLSLFNNNPQVIELGQLRLLVLCLSFFFSMIYDICAGYLSGFGQTTVPAILSMIGVCGVRLFWIFFIFPRHHTFLSILLSYPVSLGITAFLLVGALLILRPDRRREQKTMAAQAE